MKEVNDTSLFFCKFLILLRKKMNQKIQVVTILLFLLFTGNVFSKTITVRPSGVDQTIQIRNALGDLNFDDKILLIGDFTISGTLLLPSDIIWELRGTMTLAPNSPVGTSGGLQRVKYKADSRHGKGRYTIIGAVQPAYNIVMFGGVYEGDAANNKTEPNGNVLRLRFIQMMDVTDSQFFDMEIKNVSDDCFTLGNGSSYNTVSNVVGRDAGGKINPDGGNAMTDNGHHNEWTDCRAIDGGSDGWTPKCQYSTFTRCSAENNTGPGWGFYARLDGVGFDEGIEIKGNRLIDCEGFGSKHSSGVSFDISSNCPGGKVIDNYISGRYYDNNSGGVQFRNKDDANQGVIADNEVDIHCWGNKTLTSRGNQHSWAGGLGTENDSNHDITNVYGAVVSYDNVNYDVNLKGAKNCVIAAYSPNAENTSVVNQGSNTNMVTTTSFDCNTTFTNFCQIDYCDGIVVPVDPPAIDLIIEDSFEEPEGFGNWNSGGAKCVRSTVSKSDGTYSIEIKNDNSSSLMFSNKLDLVAYSEVDVEFWYDTQGSYEEADWFELQVSTDDGANYAAFADFYDDGVGNESLTVSGIIFTNETRFRFISFGNSDSDLVYFDEVKVIGSKTLSTSEVVSDNLEFNYYNYPNPFQSKTTISYQLKEGANLSIQIYNIYGQKISILVDDEYKPSGENTTIWNALGVANGMYIATIQINNKTVKSLKINLIK